ncbi:hypothetical protein [Endothiovibrio diazotrophicus]
MKIRMVWVAVAVLGVAAVAVAAHKAWPVLYPEVAASAALDPACDLSAGACVSPLPGGGELLLSLTPRPLAPMVPLQVAARIDGRAVDGVEVDFQGVKMNMGYNRIALAGEGGSYHGRAMLPVCVRDTMAWQARVLVHTGEGLIEAPFRFVARRSAAAL